MAKGKKTGGRIAGTPNKLTTEVKAAILEAFTNAGGVDYLVRQANTNPTAFMTLLGKVLPLQLTGDPENPVMIGGIGWMADQK